MNRRPNGSKRSSTSNLRRFARKLPILRFGRSLYLRVRQQLHSTVTSLKVHYLRVAPKKRHRCDEASDVIVSLTTFPERVGAAWITIESILRQSKPPGRVVVVLAEEEFTNEIVPSSITRLRSRGVEILWTSRNGRSYNKLIPTRQKYRNEPIVTVDDDVYYPRWMLSSLIEASEKHPDAVVGHRGWEVTVHDGQLLPYPDWPEANATTPEALVFLTGVGGILYPPGILPESLLLDLHLATELCPTADDVWFWAVAQSSGVPRHCLGKLPLRLIDSQGLTRSLASVNWHEGQNDIQIAATVEYFGGLSQMVAPTN